MWEKNFVGLCIGCFSYFKKYFAADSLLKNNIGKFAGNMFIFVLMRSNFLKTFVLM